MMPQRRRRRSKTQTNNEDNSKKKKTQVPEPGHSQNDLNKKGRAPPGDGTENEEDDEEQK